MDLSSDLFRNVSSSGSHKRLDHPEKAETGLQVHVRDRFPFVGTGTAGGADRRNAQVRILHDKHIPAPDRKGFSGIFPGGISEKIRKQPDRVPGCSGDTGAFFSGRDL